MAYFKGKNVLITGASMGLGYEFVKLFAMDGANLIITARSKSKLLEIKEEIEKKYNADVIVLEKDLIKKEAPEEIFNQLSENNIPVNVLVNNAGFGYYGDFSETDLDRQIDMIRLNVLSLVQLTGLFLPAMIEKGYGKIINVGSIAGFQGIPTHGIYSATKAFVMVFSESIADELEDKGIIVTCLCPGPTKTNFFKTAAIERTKISKFGLMKADKVAKIGYDALKKNKRIVISGTKNRIGIFIERFLSRKFITKLARKINEAR
ncbi:SDR family NAD(P)-dependent oxidoreductase [candidate division KSB1 bacterium]